jgi:hypothetical protein
VPVLVVLVRGLAYRLQISWMSVENSSLKFRIRTVTLLWVMKVYLEDQTILDYNFDTEVCNFGGIHLVE